MPVVLQACQCSLWRVAQGWLCCFVSSWTGEKSIEANEKFTPMSRAQFHEHLLRYAGKITFWITNKWSSTSNTVMVWSRCSWGTFNQIWVEVFVCMRLWGCRDSRKSQINSNLCIQFKFLQMYVHNHSTQIKEIIKCTKSLWHACPQVSVNL